MCPANFTTEADGSSECNLPVGTGPDLSTRYAVIVSFGMLLNGTALEDIARLAGVNASSTSILKTLVRSDTASGFNVSMGNVRVLQVTEVSKEVLFVKLSAALPVDVPADASPDDVRAAYNVKSISADHPIQLLVTDPDKFFGRTAKALNVDVEGDGKGARRTLSRPSLRHRLALEWPTILGVVLGGVLMMGLTAAVFARRRLQRAYQGASARVGAMQWKGGRGWPLRDLLQRNSSGSSVASTPSDTLPSASPGPSRTLSRPAERMLPRAHIDSAAELAC